MQKNFEDLPNEILTYIIQYLPADEDSQRTAIPTDLLLLNKRLCHLLMYEQVRHLEFKSHSQLAGWLDIIEESRYSERPNNPFMAVNNSNRTSITHYRNLLSRVDTFEMYDDDHPTLPKELPTRIASFLRRCSNLRHVNLNMPFDSAPSHDWIFQPIFRALPASVQYIHLDCEFLSSTGFRTLIDECLPRLRELRALECNDAVVEGATTHDILDLLARAPYLRDLNVLFVDKHERCVLQDSTLDAAMQLCPELRNVSFDLADGVSDKKLEEWLRTRSGKVTKLNMFSRDLSDSFLEAIAPLCPDLENLSLCGTAGFSTHGLRALLNNCRKLSLVNLTGCLHLKQDPAWNLVEGQLTHPPPLLLKGEKIAILRELLDEWWKEKESSGIIGMLQDNEQQQQDEIEENNEDGDEGDVNEEDEGDEDEDEDDDDDDDDEGDDGDDEEEDL